MAQEHGDIENLAHAYRVLDVPWDASAATIKASYRKLVKRWHPDRYRPGTSSHTESTLMTKFLNEAYARIESAPLRNGHATPFSSVAAQGCGARPDARTREGGEAEPSGWSHSEYVPHDVGDVAEFYRIMERARKAGARDDAARPFDWIGFAVRFVLGALFGGLLSFRVMISLWTQKPDLIAVGVTVPILFCAFASGFGGDAFWRAIRPTGWWWNRWG